MSDRNLLGDRYELGDVLGRGGMAEVRYGRDRRLGRAVAIKMLRVDHATDPTFQERFRREAQSAASLNHRNIVAVYDTGEDFFDGNSIPYIVMEYVEGRTLRDLLQERVRFTPERSTEITAGVLDALDYSHRAGIVHRDIKPGNVMINNAGEVKVMDFGIARSLAETGAALTQTAAVVGTAQYISPEQARGESADARSDLYAVGCVLYELLTGRPPFVGESLVSVAVSHVREMATPPSALDPSIPRDLDSVVLKALAKDRNQDRYQSAYDMRTDLERVAAGMPVSAEATAATQFIGGAAAAGYGDTAMYEPAAAGYDDGYGDYDDYDDEDDRRGMSWGALLGAGLAILAAALLIGYLVFNNDGGGEEGAQAISAPNLIGMTLEQAQADPDLAANNIEVVRGENRVEEDESLHGQIVAQDPPANTTVNPGDAITVNIAVAPEAVTVPNVINQPRDDAVAQIEDADLVAVEETEQVTDESQVGIVLDQDPRSGEVEPGSEVTITVGEAPDQVSVPDLRNLTVDDARGVLENQDLELGDEDEEASSDVEEGRIIRSEPANGQPVDPGSEIDVVVSSGPESVSLPNFAADGFTEATAEQWLSERGLSMETVDQPSCDQTPGTVVGQNPGPGSEVEPGDTVQVTVIIDPGNCDEGGGGP